MTTSAPTMIQKIQASTVRRSNWFFGLPNHYKIGIGILSLLVVVGVVKITTGSDDVAEVASATNRKVSVASVQALSNLDRDFPLIGTVTSVNEAVIRSEVGGKLTRVYRKLGDQVAAGAVIGEFENSSERASLLQAEGSYEQAKASRSIAGLNSGQAGSSLTDTRALAANSITSSYTTMDDAIRGKTDASFAYPKFEQVKLLISIPDAYLASSLERQRKAIEKMLVARELRNKSISTSNNLIDELILVEEETKIIKTYLDDLYTAYSKALPDSTFSQTALDAGQANVQTARQAITSLMASLVTTRATVSASITASQVAGTNAGVTSGTLATSDAQVKQALGAYNASLSRLEKTIIRSPIGGTLNSLTISTGDYVPAFSQVAVVSNNGALEVVSYINEDDVSRITVNSPVVLNGSVSGIVTRVASALDPTTRKIEVRIGIKDTKSGLINGQSVSITVTKNKTTLVKNKNAPIVIPLSALKLTPQGANVFTVSSTSSLVALRVKEGAILGDTIQILTGLTGTETIVIDARGLKEGITVEVETARN